MGRRPEHTNGHEVVLDSAAELHTLTTRRDFIRVMAAGGAMVFLPGEVVVDYALRLKREFDSERLWVNGYANDVPCYIPSERVLRERGYEGETAMLYYDRPTRFAPGVEDLIVGAVTRLMPREFSVR